MPTDMDLPSSSAQVTSSISFAFASRCLPLQSQPDLQTSQQFHHFSSYIVKMPDAEIKDKEGVPIQEGDNVWTPQRGGRHEGTVERVVATEAEAKQEGVKHPPKVSS